VTPPSPVVVRKRVLHTSDHCKILKRFHLEHHPSVATGLTSVSGDTPSPFSYLSCFRGPPLLSPPSPHRPFERGTPLLLPPFPLIWPPRALAFRVLLVFSPSYKFCRVKKPVTAPPPRFGWNFLLPARMTCKNTVKNWLVFRFPPQVTWYETGKCKAWV